MKKNEALVPISIDTIATVTPSTTSNAVVAYLSGLTAASSRKRMLQSLRQATQFHVGCPAGCRCERCFPPAYPWHQLRREVVLALRSTLVEKLSPACANLCISALRGTLKESWRLGLMPSDDYHRCSDLKRVKASTLIAGRSLSVKEVKKLFSSIDTSTVQGARDAALLAVFRVGLRRAELVALDLGDITVLDDGAIEVRVLHAKGRKQRQLTVPAHLAVHITRWLEHRGAEPGPLFFASNGIGRGPLVNRALSTAAIYYLLQRLARRAKVAKFSPHDLRRTTASELLGSGADISSVQKILGHSSIVTTQRYDRRTDDAAREALELLS